MNLANPQFLYFLVFIPIYLFWIYRNKKRAEGIAVSVFHDLQIAKGKKKNIYKYLKHILVVSLIIFWSISLARPQGKHEKTELGKKGIDIIIAIDVSGSMLAEDLKPNRIEAAKYSLGKFIDNLEDDRLGIVVFAGQAFTQSPLTFDYNILEEYIDNISVESINKNVRGLSGTAVGDAILSGINRFKESDERTKVMVVITDGDANTGIDPQIAAKKAHEEGIKVYTVGVGKKGGAPLPVTDMLGRKTYAKNNDGSVAMATFNEQVLRDIAKIANGKYFRAGDNKSFDKVMAEINALEKREVKVNVISEYSENFMPFLLILNILFILYLIVITYKTEVN